MSATRFSRAAFVAVIGATIGTPIGVAASGLAPYTGLADLQRRRASIARVRILSLSPDISTIVALTPDALENIPSVHSRLHAERVVVDAMVSALVRARPTNDRRPFDARFGVIFEDREGRRRFSAFTNARASHGMLGEHTVVFQNAAPLFDALERASR